MMYPANIWKVVFLILPVCLCTGEGYTLHAQSLTSQTNIFIPADLAVYVDGDFVNEGFIQNQGNFFVSGNWTNTNVYQGTGKITLNGFTSQRFTNNRNPVYHFALDGGGSKDIIGLVPVTNALELVSGIVNVSDADTLLLASGSMVIGGSVESYIDGALQYAGVGYKFFPVGTNRGYFPAGMLNVSGINPVTEVEVFEDVSPIVLPAAVTRFSEVYWQRKNISGTFLGSPVSLGYPIPDNYTNRHTLDIFQSDAPASEFSALGNITVEYGNGEDKTISGNAANGRILILGESVPPDGVPGEFYLSTSLSPSATNSDNQFVKIFGNQLADSNFKFHVYNRWGLLVFETTSLTSMITKGWDGTHKGEYLPPGAYPYILKASTKNGESFERKGVISIIH